MDQGLSLDSFQGQVIASTAKLFEHTLFLAVAAPQQSPIRTAIQPG
jgi:hypothetical protein